MKANLMVRAILRCLFILLTINILINPLVCVAEEALDLAIPETIPFPDISVTTGAAVYSIPLMVPPGRNGIEPKLSLFYNSFHKNGWVGVGWNLELGAIQRSTKNGLRFDGTDFEVIGASSTELTSRSFAWGNGYYGAKIENEFTQYYNPSPNTTGWIAKARDGITYFYGSSSNSRMSCSQGIFKWYLDKVTDMHGNYMEIEYVKLNGYVYPEHIEYAGNTNEGVFGYYAIEFKNQAENRPDPIVKYLGGDKIETRKLIEWVEIYVGSANSPSWKYKLTYDQNLINNRSRLKSLQLFGNSNGSYVSQPPTTFQYYNGSSLTYNKISSYPPSGAAMELNGDGFIDILEFKNNEFCPYLSNGDGTFQELTCTAYDLGTDVSRDYSDLDGDGKTELIAKTKKPGTDDQYEYAVYALSLEEDVLQINKKATTAAITIEPYDSSDSNSISFTYFTDMDSDGDKDLIHLYRKTGFASVRYYKNINFVFSFSAIKTYDRTSLPRAADVNGDGLMDAVFYHIGDSIKVFLQESNGQFAEGAIQTYVSGSKGLRFIDLNQDGLEDAITNDNANYYIHLSKGDGYFVEVQNFSPVGGINYADLNGDNIPDMVGFEGTGFGNLIDQDLYPYICQDNGTFVEREKVNLDVSGLFRYLYDSNRDGLSDIVNFGKTYIAQKDGPADYLSKVENGRGATTTITYGHRGLMRNTFLPFGINPVNAITITDGNGGSSTKSYIYNGGKYSSLLKEFLGFAKVTRTNPDLTRTITTYHQDKFRKGRPTAVTHKRGSNTLSQTTYTWNPVNLTQLWQFVWLDDKLSEQWNSGTKVWSRQSYAYSTSCGFPIHFLIKGTGALKIENYYQYENQDSNGWCWRRTNETSQYWVSNDKSKTLKQAIYTYYQTNSGDGSIGDLQYRYDFDNIYDTTDTEPKTAYQYDGYGNITAITNPKGYTTNISYDVDTHTYPETITNAAGHTIHKTWDYRFGKEAIVIDANQNDTLYTYDVFGRLKTTTRKDGDTTIAYIENNYADREFLNNGTPNYISNRIKESTGVFIDSRQYYDGLGRGIQSVTEGEGIDVYNVTKTYFDNMGRIQYQAGPFKRTTDAYIDWDENAFAETNHPLTKNVYDDMGRVVATETNDDDSLYSGSITPISTSYYYKGAVTEIIDPDQNKIEQTRDHLGRIIKVTEYLEEESGETPYITEYKYDGLNNVIEVIDNKGKSTTITYDLLGRKLTMSDPDMGNWSYSYDANGNLETQTDAMRQEIKFIYDEIDRLTDKIYLNKYPSVSDTQDVTYTYDNPAAGVNGIGRLHEMRNGHVTNGDVIVTYDSYDAIGRVKKVTKNIRDDISITQYAYDLAGRLTKLTYPDNTSVSYSYHAGTTLLNTVSDDSTTYATAVNYHPTGKIGMLTFGNSVNTTYTYDSKSVRMTRLLTQKDADTLMDRNYLYSSSGDIREITYENNKTFTYYYDSLHRLVSEQTNSSFQMTPSILEFDYDNGTPHHAPASVQVNGGSTYNYQYDLNGNMKSMPNLSNPAEVTINLLTYNAENMPTVINRERDDFPRRLASYQYDGDGKRAVKYGAKTTYYINDYCEVINGQLVKYIFAGNLRIAKVQGGAVTYFHKDHLGSSTLMTDAAGNVLESTAYLPYGGQRGVEAISGTGYRFTDQEFDGETGLYNYDARLYDPVIGVFVSADTIVPGGGFDPQMLNRYAYVRNNPLIYIDPSGHHLGSYEDPDLKEAGSNSFGWTGDPDGKTQRDYDLEYGNRVNGLIARAIVNQEYDIIYDLYEYYPSITRLAYIYVRAQVFNSGIVSASKVQEIHEEMVFSVAGSPAILGGTFAPKKPKWPSMADEMDDFLGVKGKKVPDSPKTPGRNKTTWNPNEKTKITLEEHPYHPDAPDWHKGKHWHLDTPKNRHERFLPGDDIPGY